MDKLLLGLRNIVLSISQSVMNQQRCIMACWKAREKRSKARRRNHLAVALQVIIAGSFVPTSAKSVNAPEGSYIPQVPEALEASGAAGLPLEGSGGFGAVGLSLLLTTPECSRVLLEFSCALVVH
jgi:hypothetical protein